MSVKIDRTGETVKARNGLKMTIIAYRTVRDIDIRFEDGYEVNHINYYNFLTGKIKHPFYRTRLKSKVGESATANNGLKMTIVAYRGTADIDIQFEDGVVVYNKTYTSFKCGEIGHPDVRTQIHPDLYVGQVSVAKNRLQMTIIAYHRNDDIDVQFEDGVIVYHHTHAAFLRGEISHPSINAKSAQAAKKYVGKTVIASNGMKMHIIAYRRKEDIDIQFEDGVEVDHIRLNNFLSGRVDHPTKNRLWQIRNIRIGETRRSTCGLLMKIVEYRSANDIDVLFEDQTMVYHKDYAAFKHGHIKYTPISPSETLIIDSLAYLHHNTANFYCRCTNCGRKDIMTIQEMKDHKCIAS